MSSKTADTKSSNSDGGRGARLDIWMLIAVGLSGGMGSDMLPASYFLWLERESGLHDASAKSPARPWGDPQSPTLANRLLRLWPVRRVWPSPRISGRKRLEGRTPRKLA